MLPPEVYEELVNRVLKKRATLRAMHILERTDKTEAQLRRKLEEIGLSDYIQTKKGVGYLLT